MVEQRPFKPLVGGSSPPAPTKNLRIIRTFQKVTHFLHSTRMNRTNSHKSVTLKFLVVTFRRSHFQWICRYSRRLFRVGARFLTPSLNSLPYTC